MSFKEFVKAFVDSKLVKAVYKAKFYFNVGIGQVDFISSKIPAVAGVVILFEFFRIKVEEKDFAWVLVAAAVGLVVFGWFMRRSGLWVVERKTEVLLDPPAREIYTMAVGWNREKAEREDLWKCKGCGKQRDWDEVPICRGCGYDDSKPVKEGNEKAKGQAK